MSGRILVVCEDIFFWARIHSAAAAKGLQALRVGDEAAMEAAFAQGGVETVFADLGVGSIDVFGWAGRWKARPDAPRIVGFVSHVDLDAQRRAREGGFDDVMPRSRFVQQLAELL